MKQALLIIFIISALYIQSSAQGRWMHHAAKTQPVKKSYKQNYRVCRIDNTYQVCDGKAPLIGLSERARKKNKEVFTALRRLDTGVNLGYQPPPENKGIKVSYDDPNAPYNGKPSKINDGVRKNMVRNINYNNSAVVLPSSSGQ